MTFAPESGHEDTGMRWQGTPELPRAIQTETADMINGTSIAGKMEKKTQAWRRLKHNSVIPNLV
ncbi:hypothetical protein ACRQ5Q_11285 [Bradyrhizobium sp. PMVTL-01]|uniref:hypothetical protein n=1 Tax=Bradyrhizobium sp. PMVTL-01 TaxID=3434999 RepID=UPI003F717E4B